MLYFFMLCMRSCREFSSFDIWVVSSISCLRTKTCISLIEAKMIENFEAWKRKTMNFQFVRTFTFLVFETTLVFDLCKESFSGSITQNMSRGKDIICFFMYKDISWLSEIWLDAFNLIFSLQSSSRFHKTKLKYNN